MHGAVWLRGAGDERQGHRRGHHSRHVGVCKVRSHLRVRRLPPLQGRGAGLRGHQREQGAFPRAAGPRRQRRGSARVASRGRGSLRAAQRSRACVGAQMGFFAEAGPLQVFVSNYVRRPRPLRAHNRNSRWSGAPDARARRAPLRSSFRRTCRSKPSTSRAMCRPTKWRVRCATVKPLLRTCALLTPPARGVAGAHPEGERGPPAHRGHAQRRQRNRACCRVRVASPLGGLTRAFALCVAQFCVGTIKDNYLGLIGEAQ